MSVVEFKYNAQSWLNKTVLNEINLFLNLDKTKYMSFHTRHNGNKPNIDINIDKFNIEQLKILSFWVCL